MASFCCSRVDQWWGGRDEAGWVTASLEPLKFGEVASAPVQDRWTFVIAKRLDPATVPLPRSTSIGIPSPEQVDLEELLRRTTESQGFMEKQVRQVNADVAPQAMLRADVVQALDAAAANLDAATEREQRARRYWSFLKEAESILGAEAYTRYLAALQAHFDAFFVH